MKQSFQAPPLCTSTSPSRLSQSLLAVDLVLLVVRFKKNIFLFSPSLPIITFLGITLGSRSRAHVEDHVCVKKSMSETIRKTMFHCAVEIQIAHIVLKKVNVDLYTKRKTYQPCKEAKFNKKGYITSFKLKLIWNEQKMKRRQFVYFKRFRDRRFTVTWKGY